MTNSTNKAKEQSKAEEIKFEAKAKARAKTNKNKNKKDFTSLKEVKKHRNTTALTGLLVLGILLCAAACGFLAKDSESWLYKIAKAIIGQGQYTINIGCFQIETNWSADPQRKTWGFSLRKV